MKRIITVQDISCVGRCSLTVALPIISALGIEACPLPTALLSTHTAFDSFEFFDLTDKMPKITEAFKKQKLDFDGIYSGYLGSVEQIDLLCSFVDGFKTPSTLVLVDPCMADNGKLYAGFDKDFPSYMLKLCKKADIIVPNLTEASFLLGRDGTLPYSTEKDVLEILKELTETSAKTCVLTGVEFDGKLGAASYNRETKEFSLTMRDKIPALFHGTGDIFASVLFGSLIRNATLQKSVDLAVDFTCASMRATLNDKDMRWYGVNFESELKMLTDAQISM